MGDKGSVQQIGYLIYECPSCRTGEIFAVHQAKKKFTLYFIPTFSYSNKQYMECLTCHDSFEVPSEMKPIVERNLLSQAELSRLIARQNQDNEPVLETPKVQALPSATSTSCDSCGATMSAENKFCPQCGFSLGFNKAAEEMAPARALKEVHHLLEQISSWKRPNGPRADELLYAMLDRQPELEELLEEATDALSSYNSASNKFDRQLHWGEFIEEMSAAHAALQNSLGANQR